MRREKYLLMELFREKDGDSGSAEGGVDMIEKPSIKEAHSRFVALGRYVITPEDYDILEQTKPGKRYDTGNKLGYLKAVVEFALMREDLREEFGEYLKTLRL